VKSQLQFITSLQHTHITYIISTLKAFSTNMEFTNHNLHFESKRSKNPWWVMTMLTA